MDCNEGKEYTLNSLYVSTLNDQIIVLYVS